MSVHFRRNRLHVGYRLQDWTDVWYAPIGESDDEGEAELGLFRLPHGEAGRREPMEGQILWHPPFDIANCESKRKLERVRMQRQFLTDAWRYLSENFAPRVLEMERDLDQPGFSRWQKWFSEAKKWKKTHMRQAERRRAAKIARGLKVGPEDTDDSAYDSSEDLFVGPSAQFDGGAATAVAGPSSSTFLGSKRQDNTPPSSARMPPPKRSCTKAVVTARSCPSSPAPFRAVHTDTDDTDDEREEDDDDNAIAGATMNKNNELTTSNTGNTPTAGGANLTSDGNDGDEENDDDNNASVRSGRSAFLDALFASRATPNIRRERTPIFRPLYSSGKGKARVQPGQTNSSALNGGLDEAAALNEALRRSIAPEIISLPSSDELSATYSPDTVVVDEEAPDGNGNAVAGPESSNT